MATIASFEKKDNDLQKATKLASRIFGTGSQIRTESSSISVVGFNDNFYGSFRGLPELISYCQEKVEKEARFAN